MWAPEKSAGDRETLLLSTRYFHASFADHSVQALVRPRKQRVSRGLVQHIQALLVGRAWIDEEKVLSDRAGEELSILGNEPDTLAQGVEIHRVARQPVIKNPPALRRIQPDQQLDQRRLPGARRSHERDRLAALHREGNVTERRRGGRLVHEPDVVELELLDVRQWNRIRRLRIFRRLENLPEVRQRSEEHTSELQS